MLYILLNKDYELSKFIFSSLEQDSKINLIHIPPLAKGKINSIKKFIDKILIPYGFKPISIPSNLKKTLDKITAEDSVLFFGIDNESHLDIINKNIKCHKKSLFLWNPVNGHKKTKKQAERYISSLKSKVPNIFTFDPNDAATYKISLKPQLFRDIKEIKKTPQDIDFLFIGQDKNRLNDLIDFKERVNKVGFSVHFHITPDRGKEYSQKNYKYLSKENISYTEVINLISRSKCLIEVLQKGQSGYTIRTLEAVFFKKKLLTNRNISTTEKIDQLKISASNETLKQYMASPTHDFSTYHSEKEIKNWIESFK